jgi:hypothetical protein
MRVWRHGMAIAPLCQAPPSRKPRLGDTMTALRPRGAPVLALVAVSLVAILAAIPVDAQDPPAPSQPGPGLAPTNRAPDGAGSPAPTGRRPAVALPTWRLQARPYTDYDGDFVLGIYRRIGSTWDAGLQVGTVINTDEDTGDERGYDYDGSYYVRTQRTADDYYSVSVSFDLRQWRPIAARLAWYLGPRFSLSFSDRKFENEELYESDDLTGTYHRDTHDRGWAVEVGSVVGADLGVTRRLSLTFALVPLRVTREWSDRQALTRRTSSDIQQPQGGYTRDEGDGLSVRTGLDAQLFLTLLIG